MGSQGFALAVEVLQYKESWWKLRGGEDNGGKGDVSPVVWMATSL